MFALSFYPNIWTWLNPVVQSYYEDIRKAVLHCSFHFLKELTYIRFILEG